MGKIRVAVLMGGISTEHEISLKSGAMVLKNLDTTRYDTIPAVIGKDGAWRLADDLPCPITEALPRLMALAPDCVFIALHGPFGEDGRVQGLLDMVGIPYVGSGCAASALSMDKIRAKAVARDEGIPTGRQLTFTLGDWREQKDAVTEAVAEEFGFPCVVKSPCQGSTLGMGIPDTLEEFEGAVEEVFRHGHEMLVEEFLPGVEVTCSVLDDGTEPAPRALPVTEIRPKSGGTFDYHAKYTPGATDEITPARISPELTERVQDFSVRAHVAMGCCGFTRSDFIVVEDQPVWLEINTIPGLTETSLFPQAAAAAGIRFPELLDRLVRSALGENAHTRVSEHAV